MKAAGFLRSTGALASIAGLVMVVVAACLLMGAAFQARSGYSVSMDSPFSTNYLTDGWHEQENNGQFSYRWASGYSIVHFPAVGRQPLKLTISMGTERSDPHPQKDVTITSRGALVAIFHATNGINPFEVTVPPELVSRTTGDLDLVITTSSFSPKGDARQLGVIVTSLGVEPAGGGTVFPPLRHVLFVVGIVAALYLIVWLLGFGLLARLIGGVADAVCFGLFYAFSRSSIAFYTSSLMLVAALVLVSLPVAQAVVSWWYRRAGLPFRTRSQEGRVLFGLFAAGLLLAWGGLLYPQSDPHDFGFHLHRFQEVQGGNLFFNNYVVSGVGQGFYPPAMYVLLLPFSLLMHDPTLLVKLAPALFDFAGIFLVFYLAKRYMVDYSWAPSLSAALYATLPVNLLIVWWAHETNLFGLVVLLATVTYMLEQYGHMHNPLVWIGLVALAFVVFLSHPGVLVWSIVLLGALLLLFAALRRFTGRGSYRSVGAMVGAVVVAAALAFVLYYSHYINIFGKTASVQGRGQSELSDTLSSLGDMGGLLDMLRLTLYHGVLGDYGLLPLLLAPPGLWLLFRRRQAAPRSDAGTEGSFVAAQQRFRWSLLVWLVVGLFFLTVSIVTAIPIRPMLFLWPLVALLAGYAAAVFAGTGASRRSGAWRRAAAGALLVVTGGLSLYLWLLANFLDMRIPHVFPLVF